MLLLYAIARLLQLYSAVTPSRLIVTLHVLIATRRLPALLHGARTYRLQGSLVFAGLSLGVGALFEILSLRTGFPFGHYHFTGVVGPKLFDLPILLALAYVGMGYVAWFLATIILGPPADSTTPYRLFTLPLLASCIMLAWDLSMEPVWATVFKAWIWENGGPYFSVPLSNFIGWFLTAYVFYQLFALYLRHREPSPRLLTHPRLPIFFYALAAIGNLLLLVPPETALHFPSIVLDASGRPWPLADILAATTVVSMLVMVPFACVAWKIAWKVAWKVAPTSFRPTSFGGIVERNK